MRRGASALVLAASLLVPSGAASGADKALTATGTIVRIDARERTVVVALTEGSEATFVWTPETRISGTMAAGARVTLRYTPGDGGRNLATQITVTRS